VLENEVLEVALAARVAYGQSREWKARISFR
jgi:hypothetical protein